MYKIIVNIPNTHTEKLINVMAEAGAGIFGNYSHCAFITRGKGTAKPLEGSNPYIGKVGQLYYEDEDKVETLCAEEHLAKVIDAINSVHPYESPIIEVYEVKTYTKQ